MKIHLLKGWIDLKIKKFAPFAIHFVSYENEINDFDNFFNQHF